MRKKRIDMGRRRIGLQIHVRRFDALPARDRRTVEGITFEGTFIDARGIGRHMLHLTFRVREPQVHELDILVLDHFQDIASGFHEFSPLRTRWSDFWMV